MLTRQLFIGLLISIAVCLISFNGSAQTGQPIDNGNKPKANTNGHSKIVRTQHTGAGQNVHCGLQDKAGNFWFGTTGEGVYRRVGNSFIQLTVAEGLNSNVVWSMLEDRAGNIWFGTNDGICRYDGKSITRSRISVAGDGYSYHSGSSGNPLSKRFDVWSIMQDKAGLLWFATTAGVFCYDGTSFTRFLDNGSIQNKSGFQDNRVEYILEDKAGHYWFGGRMNGGVFRYDGKSIERLFPDGELWAWPVLQDRKGNIWFSNWKGVYRYDGNTFTTITTKEGLCSKNITRIIEDRNGILWFGGEGKDGGLCRYDGKTFTHWTTKDGLINDSVWMILEDSGGNIWIGTRNVGLCRYDGKGFVNFSE